MNKKEIKEAEEQLAAAYLKVMGDDAGRLVLTDLLRESGAFQEPYVAGDAYGTARECGKKGMGLYVLHNLGKHPEAYISFQEANMRDARTKKNISETQKQKGEEDEST